MTGPRSARWGEGEWQETYLAEVENDDGAVVLLQKGVPVHVGEVEVESMGLDFLGEVYAVWNTLKRQKLRWSRVSSAET